MGVFSSLVEAPLLPAAGAGNNASPVTTYLGRLAPGSRRGQLAALSTVALLISKGSADAQGINWASLTYPQAAAVRATSASRPIRGRTLPCLAGDAQG
jgi:hypothetical protein